MPGSSSARIPCSVVWLRECKLTRQLNHCDSGAHPPQIHVHEYVIVLLYKSWQYLTYFCVSCFLED
jgi:hypothetical protein